MVWKRGPSKIIRWMRVGFLEKSTILKDLQHFETGRLMGIFYYKYSHESLRTVSFQDGHIPQMNKIKQVLQG